MTTHHWKELGPHQNTVAIGGQVAKSATKVALITQAIAALICAATAQALRLVVVKHTAHAMPVSKLSPMPVIIGHNERN